ncbi:hypothetical protein [Cohnella nanjingensis]|uniref:Uncharacterized protein n=1 Tax=Cohnella nanjingensis TaxID=1387779 RepID=A0A7X0RLB4_9BACL|nr:hypothetical protein [Cohnella nanjingensis]MBB6669587.1 hypothetical protein [Cohnella nanjingensis]
MREREPDWYARLKGNPVREPGFTEAQMSRIERRAWGDAQMRNMIEDRRSSRGRRSNRLRASAAVALIVIVGLTALWRFGGTGSHVAEPPAPSQIATAPGPNGGATQNPQSDWGEAINPERLEGTLGDQLPFSTEDVEEITVQPPRSGPVLTVPKARMYVLLQNLNGLDLKAARMPEGQGPEYYMGSSDSSTLIFKASGKNYTLDYDPASNTYGIIGGKGTRFYADDQVWLFLQSLLNSGSVWADYGDLTEQGRVEAENSSGNGEPNNKSYKPDRLQVSGRDYNAWEQQFLVLSSGIRYCDSSLGTSGFIQMIGQGNEPDVLRLGQTIVFATDANRTSDGIGVGLTADEVVRKLGEPNAKTDTKWSYRIGDYLKFHLLFEQGKVRFMVLTMPA